MFLIFAVLRLQYNETKTTFWDVTLLKEGNKFVHANFGEPSARSLSWCSEMASQALPSREI
jgi:hypothetical protein